MTNDGAAARVVDEAEAAGDRISGMQAVQWREGPADQRISVSLETDAGTDRPGSQVQGSHVPENEVDPCAAVPVMGELGLARGTMIAGTYRIVRPLGAGGMGVVALAHDDRLDRDVAIKFVRPELFAKDAGLQEMFLGEARAMARVAHANVVTIHTIGEHAGVPYFVMEYVDGPTAEQWLEHRAGVPDLDAGFDLLVQTCLGVEAIHAAATVHRDLKPSNLLLKPSALENDGRPTVAVSDLGVARMLDSGDAQSTLVGSAAYMSPEAAIGDDSKPELATRRDIYALGCLAYELLAGRPPFVAPTDMGLVAKHLVEIPPALSTLRPELPSSFDEILLRALAKDPEKRWRTVGAFRRALERARIGEDTPERILIVDDDPDWRALLQESLAPRFPDAQVDVVANGEEAIEAFTKHPYSVVLVDLQMPNVDGMELTAYLRSVDGSEQTPIIVLTAAGGPREWRRLSQIGADGFLVKPVDPEDVSMLIRRTMKSRHQRASQV